MFGRKYGSKLVYVVFKPHLTNPVLLARVYIIHIECDIFLQPQVTHKQKAQILSLATSSRVFFLLFCPSRLHTFVFRPCIFISDRNILCICVFNQVFWILVVFGGGSQLSNCIVNRTAITLSLS